MNVLLDTHLFIWWLKDDKRLSKKASTLISNAHEIFISSASIWEAGIKIQLGKLEVDINALVDSIEKEGFVALPITPLHASYVAKLPSHHRDPFDRMLIAQAICEPLHLLTVDEKLKAYSELVVLV